MDKGFLEKKYLQKHKSMKEIAGELDCSVDRIVYYMNKYCIKRRSISDAIYTKHNPHGDPFAMNLVKTKEQAQLMGIGIGLFWGEGNKANKYSVRLGNTDPKLLKTFIEFLVNLCGVNRDSLRFGLQTFTNINTDEALAYWSQELGVRLSQFYRVTVTIPGSIGTYRRKSQYGVVTVYYHNKKFRDILIGMLPR